MELLDHSLVLLHEIIQVRKFSYDIVWSVSALILNSLVKQGFLVYPFRKWKRALHDEDDLKVVLRKHVVPFMIIQNEKHVVIQRRYEHISLFSIPHSYSSKMLTCCKENSSSKLIAEYPSKCRVPVLCPMQDLGFSHLPFSQDQKTDC